MEVDFDALTLYLTIALCSVAWAELKLEAKPRRVRLFDWLACWQEGIAIDRTMAETSEATGAAAERSKKDLAEAAGGEKVIKLAIDGMGWHILNLLDFEMVVYPESKIGKGRFVVNEYACQVRGSLSQAFSCTTCKSVCVSLQIT